MAVLLLNYKQIRRLLNHTLLAEGIVKILWRRDDHLILNAHHLLHLEDALSLHLDHLIVTCAIVEPREGEVVQHRHGIERVILQPHIVSERQLAHILFHFFFSLSRTKNTKENPGFKKIFYPGYYVKQKKNDRQKRSIRSGTHVIHDVAVGSRPTHLPHDRFVSECKRQRTHTPQAMRSCHRLAEQDGHPQSTHKKRSFQMQKVKEH